MKTNDINALKLIALSLHVYICMYINIYIIANKCFSPLLSTEANLILCKFVIVIDFRGPQTSGLFASMAFKICCKFIPVPKGNPQINVS